MVQPRYLKSYHSQLEEKIAMNRPIGAMIIALLMFLRGLWGLLTGSIALGLGTFTFFVSGLYAPGSVAIYWSIATLIIAVITLVLAYGLFAMRPWAWMWTVIVLVISLLIDVISGFGGGFNWISIILGVIILAYLAGSGVRSAYTEA
jgi:hypothetical protein